MIWLLLIILIGIHLTNLRWIRRKQGYIFPIQILIWSFPVFWRPLGEGGAPWLLGLTWLLAEGLGAGGWSGGDPGEGTGESVTGVSSSTW